MVLEKHWYHAYEIYKCSYHLDSTIPRGSVTSLLLGIAMFRGSVSFVRGVESKALDNSLPRYYFHKEVSTTKSPFNPSFFEANLQMWPIIWTLEKLRDINGWAGTGCRALKQEYWRSHLPFFNFIDVLSTLKMGKSNKPPDQPSPFENCTFNMSAACRFLRTSWDELNKFWIISSMRSWIHTRVIISQHHWLRLLAPTPSLPG